MRMPWTLSVYVGRHVLQGLLVGLAGLIAITLLVEMVELIRRAAGKDAITFGLIVQMALFKLPALAEKLLPYAVLIGSMLALTRLTRTHELVVARAAGLSVWQFLAPAAAVMMAAGVFAVTIFNPLSAALLMRFEQMDHRHFSGRPSMLSVSASGLWLRQIEEGGERLIHALRVSPSDMRFSTVIVFSFDANHRFIERLDAEHAVLEEGMLRLSGVARSVPGEPPQRIEEFRLPTALTLAHIQDSFASPETLSFWELPSFIAMLEQAGFSAIRHKLYWNSLLAKPFLLGGSVLIAALFSLRLPRRGKIGILIAAGVLAGFLLHFFTDVVFALGAAGTLPIWLAAWAPALIVFFLGSAMLLHLEDG